MKLKGNTVEEKLKHVEVLFKHMGRKLHKTVVGIIPPSLVSSFVQEPLENGLVLTAALPGGRITKGLIVVKDMPKDGVSYTLKTVESDVTYLKTITTKKKVLVVDLDLELSVGTVLELWVDGDAKGIWTSFLWESEMGDKQIKQILLNELDALEEA